MPIRSAAVLVFSLFLLISTRIDAAPTTQPARVMNLLVVDSASAAPLEGVSVDRSGDDGPPGLTGRDGRISIPIEDNPNAYVGAEVHLDGYVDKLIQWRPNDKDPIPDSYVLKLEKGTIVRGRVVDDAGEPVNGATVVINLRLADEAQWPRDGHERPYISYRTVTSAADGNWLYNGAPAEFESAEIGVWHYHYASGEFFDFKKLSAAQARDGIATVTLPRGVPIEGIVVDQDDKPIGDAKVMYGGEMASNKMDPQKTGADGHFTYAAKPGEEVVLTVTSKGYSPELSIFRMTEDKQEPKIVLAPSRPLFGRIVGPDGEPVPGAWVYPDTWRGRRSLETRIHADNEGKFVWQDAPVDAVKTDIDATSAGYVREEMNLTASDQEIVVTVRKALHVTGTVVDDETGQPIDSFNVVRGIDWGNRPEISWQRQKPDNKPHGGKFDYNENWHYPGFAVRIEADGYLPDERRGFKIDDHEVNFEFRLKKADNIKMVVLKPDGSPAAKAKGYLVLADQNIQIYNDIEVSNHSCPESVVDDQGRLQFPPQTGDFILLIISPDGFIQLPQSALADANPIKLEAWGRIEGTLSLDGKPASNELISVSPQTAQPMRNRPQIFHELSVKTGAQGRFSFEHVPPGVVTVSRRVDQPMGNGSFRINQSLTQHVTVNAGELTTVNLGSAPDGAEAK